MTDEDRFLPAEQWIRRASDDELREDLRQSIAWANSQTGVVQSVNAKLTRAAFVREVLHERSMDRSSKRIEVLTRRIELLTWFIAALTLGNVVLVALSLINGG